MERDLLEIIHLRLILATEEEGSLAKAAERLHLSASALSHRLRSIEERLGTRLFHRAGKSLHLTNEGQIILKAARSVLATIDNAEAELRDVASGSVGRLRISTQCYTAYHWLPGLCAVFRRDFPKVEIDLVTEATRRPIQALKAGEVDLVITNQEIVDKQILTRFLFEDEKVAIVPPGHPWTHRSVVNVDDFSDVHLIVHNKEENTFINNYLIPSKVRPARVSDVQTTDGIREMVKAGLGVAVLARWAAAPDLNSGALAAVQITSCGLRRRWVAALMQEFEHPDYVWRFINQLESINFSDTLE